MADMIGVSIVLVLFATAFPAYLAVVWRTWPAGVERARERLERTPGRSLVLGVLLAALIAVPISVLLLMPNGVAQFLGYTLLVLGLAYAGIGAAGFASRVGGGAGLRGMLIGAAVTEFAMALPVIGWFVVTPLLLLASLGAGTFALLRWRPRAAAAPAVVAPSALATDPR